MTRESIFELINGEREYQDNKWGAEFDLLNTPNDWVSYITSYTSKAVTLPWDRETFRKNILKVATLAVAVLERDTYAPRHYDKQERL